MKQIENFFDFETNYAKKHKLNTCNKKVPQEFLDKIEQGCSIENLEEMMMERFDVFKYRTQITIHGIFPELSTRCIGGYVNLTQNKNKSVGVRYNAIDYEKKKRLFSMLKTLGIWYAERNSQNYIIFKMQRIDTRNKEQIITAVHKYEEEAKTIDRKLFVGNVYCNLQEDLWGRIYVVLTVNICCFYEANFKSLFENLSGMSYSDGEKKVAEIVEKEERERAERNARWEVEAAKRREEEAKKKEELLRLQKDFVENNPLKGFTMKENYLPRKGEILGYPHYDRYSGEFKWNFRKVKICFGKINASPCDKNGEKIRDWSRKGKTITEPIKKIYVKSAV